MRWTTLATVMEDVEKFNMLLFQMKATEEVLQVEPERKGRDLETGNSFVNICRFGLSFRFMDEPRPPELNLAVLQPAAYRSTWHGEAYSGPCNTFSNMTEKLYSLLSFSLYSFFLLYFMEGELSSS